MADAGVLAGLEYGSVGATDSADDEVCGVTGSVAAAEKARTTFGVEALAVASACANAAGIASLPGGVAVALSDVPVR